MATTTTSGASVQFVDLTVGERLKLLREQHGLKQSELAVPSQRITNSYISRVESGERNLSLRALRVLADRLGVSPVLLETGEMYVCPHCGGKPPA